MAELNIIHPFREGNGRTIREFIRQYALELGYKIDWSKVSKDQLLIAMIESVLDKSNLEKCIDICML
jgi:cell filamentation protein